MGYNDEVYIQRSKVNFTLPAQYSANNILAIIWSRGSGEVTPRVQGGTRYQRETEIPVYKCMMSIIAAIEFVDCTFSSRVV